MRFHNIFLLLFFSVLSITSQEKNQLKTIDNFLQLEYPKNEPGASILISKKGKIIYEKAFGLASLKPKRKLKTDMIFQIGSMSKQFVSAAILQLVEQGKIKLSDSIQKHVPYYPSKKHKITIHNLLSQTSGIPNYFDVDENEYDLLAQEYTPKELLDFYKEEPLLFKPGTKWEYSNSNYPLLGLAIENSTGLSLKKYLRENIFEPLQMESTGLWYRKNTNKKNIVKGYETVNEKLIPGPKIVGSALYAPGGIVSTIRDLYLWNEALKNRTFLSDFIVDNLTTEKKTNDGKGTGYGYGFFLRNIQGNPTIQHGGILFGFTSNGVYLPNEDIFICILSNTKFDRVDEISNYVASVLLNKPIQILSKKEISAKKLKQFEGQFELQGKIQKTVNIKVFDNQLLFSDPKNPAFDAFLQPRETDVFKIKNVKGTVTFLRNSNNKIIGFKVLQGEEYTFKKVK